MLIYRLIKKAIRILIKIKSIFWNKLVNTTIEYKSEFFSKTVMNLTCLEQQTKFYDERERFLKKYHSAVDTPWDERNHTKLKASGGVCKIYAKRGLNWYKLDKRGKEISHADRQTRASFCTEKSACASRRRKAWFTARFIPLRAYTPREYFRGLARRLRLRLLLKGAHGDESGAINNNNTAGRATRLRQLRGPIGNWRMQSATVPSSCRPRHLLNRSRVDREKNRETRFLDAHSTMHQLFYGSRMIEKNWGWSSKVRFSRGPFSAARDCCACYDFCIYIINASIELSLK